MIRIIWKIEAETMPFPRAVKNAEPQTFSPMARNARAYSRNP